MTITSGIVLFAVIWFLALFVVLPLRLTTQDEANDVTPGTPSSAPVDPKIPQKVKIATAAAVVLWSVIALVIVSGAVTMADIDIFNTLDPDFHSR
jgi:predicted secreted protein